MTTTARDVQDARERRDHTARTLGELQDAAARLRRQLDHAEHVLEVDERRLRELHAAWLEGGE